MVSVRLLAAVLCYASLATMPALGRGRDATPALTHLERVWKNVADYSMTITAHEVLGDASADSVLAYAFRRPDRARLDVLAGNKSGSTMALEGDHVVAYMRAFSAFKKRGGLFDTDLTSLRGNGIRNPNVADLIACFDAHRSGLRQLPGPVVEGVATDEVQLPYAGIVCPNDPVSDRGTVTLDAIDIARDTGYIVLRKRYAGAEIVERWEITGYKINTGLADADLE